MRTEAYSPNFWLAWVDDLFGTFSETLLPLALLLQVFKKEEFLSDITGNKWSVFILVNPCFPSQIAIWSMFICKNYACGGEGYWLGFVMWIWKLRVKTNTCSPRLHQPGCRSPQILSIDSEGRRSPPELPNSEYLKWALKQTYAEALEEKLSDTALEVMWCHWLFWCFIKYPLDYVR